MKADNIYEHADGGFYCLISPETPMKHPDTGEWLPGVTYTGTDGLMRSTTHERWDERFTSVAEYTGDDESVMMMIRRCNPGDRDLDFVAVFESWHESEIGITGHMLELAVAAAMEKCAVAASLPDNEPWELTITTKDLQRVVQNYEIVRVPEPHGFRFEMRKSFPNSA